MADSTEKATFDFTPDQLIRAEKELRKASADLIEESMVCPDVIYVDLALLKDIWIGAVNVILSDRKATPEDFHKAHRGILDRVIPYMKRYRHDIGKYFPHLGVTTKDVETILADPARHDEIFIASPVTQFVNTLRANLDINANHANVSERFTKRNMGDGRYTREFQIQSKVVEIYNYFSNFLSGKRGFIQGNYASRRIALGTRNVIAAATFNAATPDDPQMLKVDETRVGLFQTLKAFQPCVVYGFRTLFINHVFGEEGTAVNIPLINPKTISLEYVEVSDEVRKMYTTSDGIGGWINRFRNTDVRFKPITIKGENGKYYYLCMVYDTGDSIYYFRTMTDLKNFLPGGNVDKSKIRPITWAEAFYTAVYLQTRDCHVFVTRYPVIEDTSCYPSRIHISTTSTARIVTVRDLLSGGEAVINLPEYPILRSSFIDTVSVAPSKLAGLGGDHDGDTVSINGIISETANDELRRYLSSPKSMLDVQRKFITGGATDLVDLTFNVLSQPPKKREAVQESYELPFSEEDEFEFV